MKNVFQSVCLAIASLFVLSPDANAGFPESFHCSGTGIFDPSNIGMPFGGNAGVVLGDGSGKSQYTASGDALTIGGQAVGTGFHTHDGGNISYSTGFLNRKKTKITWPTRSSRTHVLTSEDGTIHFVYPIGSSYQFDLTTGRFTGSGLFFIVGGSGRFKNASGAVWVDVAVPFVFTELPPPGVPLAVPFEYNFDGVIVLDD